MAVVLALIIFVALLIASGRNLDLSPAYLLVIAYLLWMKDRGKHYFFLGAIISVLMAIGFLLTHKPETRTINLIYYHFMMVTLVWVVIYFIYHQKRLIESAKNNGEQLNAMFENATEGILLVDDQGKILILNKFAERLFGYIRTELIGEPVEILIPQRFSRLHADHREEYHKDPHNRPMGSGMNLYALHKEGREFPVEVSLGYYVLQDRQTVIVFVNDITERIKVSQQLILEKELTQKLNQELEAKVAERTWKLEEALSNLEKNNKILKNTEIVLSNALIKEKELGELKSRFVSMASHEFRTPLTTILSSVFLLENSKGQNQHLVNGVHLDRIKKSAKNLTSILSEFLSLSKLDEGKVELDYSLTDVQLLIGEILEELGPLKKEDQSISHFHFGISEPQLIDGQSIRIILINLLSNAIKFSPVDGNIELISHIDTQELKFIVSDLGIGVPEDEQKHLFSRFFRAKNAQNIEGTGLGLNIVKKYVELMQGKIELKSAANQGTSITVTIPI